MEGNRTRDDFKKFLRNYHDVEVLRDWALRNNLQGDPDVEDRIKEIISFNAQTQDQETEHLWSIIINSFSSEGELRNFARMNQCLYDAKVQEKLKTFNEVCD